MLGTIERMGEMQESWTYVSVVLHPSANPDIRTSIGWLHLDASGSMCSWCFIEGEHFHSIQKRKGLHKVYYCMVSLRIERHRWTFAYRLAQWIDVYTNLLFQRVNGDRMNRFWSVVSVRLVRRKETYPSN